MQKLNVYALTENPFDLIGKQWAMVTTRRGVKINTMTASWGGVGVLWNKPVVYLFIRPQRYTREMLDDSNVFSVCFLPDEMRSAMTYCGKASGRDGDKLAACGLSTGEIEDVTVLEESNLTFLCKKLFCQELVPESFIEKNILEDSYSNRDYHYMYVAEITAVYQKEKEAEAE